MRSSQRGHAVDGSVLDPGVRRSAGRGWKPTSKIRVLRALWRQRGEHAQALAQGMQRMQQALTEMNVQLADVIEDISVVTGQAIIRKILAGERALRKLARLKDHRTKAREKTISMLHSQWPVYNTVVLATPARRLAVIYGHPDAAAENERDT